MNPLLKQCDSTSSSECNNLLAPPATLALIAERACSDYHVHTLSEKGAKHRSFRLVRAKLIPLAPQFSSHT